VLDFGENQNQSKVIENKIIEFIVWMKEKENKNHGAIKNYTTPVISFYKINDITLNTSKIMRFMPPKTRVRKNRGYEYEEIQKLLHVADDRMKAVILILVSSGCRVGAIPTLHLRDLTRIESDNLYKITIYENQEEEYYSFLTPEASNAVDDYLDMRRRYGEKVGPDSPLIREQFDVRDPFSIASPKPLNVITLKNKLVLLGERAGIRERSHLAECRKEVPAVHGLRKSFSTFADNAGMNIIQRRMLEGHSVGIDDHYIKPRQADLLAEYRKAIDALTIDPSKRLQRKVEKLETERDSLASLKDRLAALEAMAGKSTITKQEHQH
jgi:integrase